MEQLTSQHAALRRTDVRLLRESVYARWPQLRGLPNLAVFGSRAVGLERFDSDWDIFCVGATLRPRASDLDFVLRSTDEAEATRWLASELAHHIAVFGVWLTDVPSWLSAVRHSEAAVTAKAEAIADTVHCLRGRWGRLLPTQRAKYLQRLRRDLQRLHVLSTGAAVPPTALLDRSWDPSQLLADFASTPAMSSLCSRLIFDIGSLETLAAGCAQTSLLRFRPPDLGFQIC